MCNQTGLEFVHANLFEGDVRGKRVIEVGSRDVNGSARQIVCGWAPTDYVGVDIEEGPGVDVLCDAEDLVGRFGPGSFDVLISTEMLEHVRDWRRVVSNIKRVVRPGGVILLTTRSRGFVLHGYPCDFWRYELRDIRVIFADCVIERLEADAPAEPGVFTRLRKPAEFDELDLSGYYLYSILRNRPAARVSDAEFALIYLASKLWATTKDHLPSKVFNAAKATFRGLEGARRGHRAAPRRPERPPSDAASH